MEADAERLRVAQPSPGGGRPLLRAGLVRWRDPHPRISLIVKATLDVAARSRSDRAVATLATEQMQLALDQPCDWPDAAADELFYASDFVPKKAAADILVVGHAHAAAPEARIRAGFRLGDVARRFDAIASAPRRRIPLARRNLRAAPGGDAGAAPVGPIRRSDEPLPDVLAHFDFATFQSAAPEQRTRFIPADGELVLEGLSPRVPRRTVRLPGLRPRARLVFEEGEMGREVRLVCDTLWLDVDREIAVLVWRGTIDVASFETHGIDRVLLWLGDAEAESLDDGGRHEVNCAIEERDFVDDATPDADEAKMAVYAGWDDPAEPTLALADYARIAAELAEGREPRHATLDRHGLDEDGWAVEERAWLERMASAAMKGDASPAVEFGERFVVAQDALARQEEEAVTLDDYASLQVAMERTTDPSKLLESRTMTLPVWLRLDRRWTRRASADPAIASRLDAALAARRAESGPAEEAGA